MEIKSFFNGAMMGAGVALLGIITKQRNFIKKGLFCHYSSIQHDPELLHVLKNLRESHKTSLFTVSETFQKLVGAYDELVYAYLQSDWSTLLYKLKEIPLICPLTPDLERINKSYHDIASSNQS